MNTNIIEKWLQCWKTQALNERLKPVLTTYLSKSSSHGPWYWTSSMWKLWPKLTLITNRLQNSHLWRSNQCWKSTVPNSTWRLLTDSNLSKWNIFVNMSNANHSRQLAIYLVSIRICIEATAGRHDPYVDGRYVLAFWQRYQPWVSTCPWC